ncbi:MAG: hypothetical protein CBE24_02665 [bacterium TMED264]|nr:MAG: hypothetical protein CBE24_02665 [bacterium TMED264]|tara:strand:+ start:84 stop:1025 length:942 start_codon:yes stop_codon:yes gene_type:complete
MNKKVTPKPLSSFRTKTIKPRRKNQSWDWTKKTDQALERYFKWEHKPHIQKRIYQEHLQIPLNNIARIMLNRIMWKGQGDRLINFDTNKETSLRQEKENIINELESIFFTTVCPYVKQSFELVEEGKEPTIPNIFGYILQSFHNHLIDVNVERTMNSIGGSKFESLPTNSEGYKSTKADYNFLLHKKGLSIDDENIKKVDGSFTEEKYLNSIIDYWDFNIDKIWKRKNQQLSRQTARNVVELFQRSKNIKHFKVVSMRRYLRKMMGWKKGDGIYNSHKRNIFNDIIMFMKRRNKLLRKQFIRTGYIDYYYLMD